ncbi:MAG: translocation/assembly module TamB domain-containing protein [Elusimicrobiota bacterium]
MLKKAAYISAAIVIVILISLFFAWRLRFLELPVRMAIKNLTGKNAAFEKIEYRPFNKITINALFVGQNFRCQKVTIYFNPFKFLLNLRHPAVALDHINLEKPWIKADRGLPAYLKTTNDRGKPSASSKTPQIKITWDSGEIYSSAAAFSDFCGTLTIAENISGKISAKSGANRIESGFNLDPKDGHLTGNASAVFEGPESGFEVHAEIERNAGNDLSLRMSFPRIRWKEYELNNSSGILSSSKSGVAGELRSAAGRIWLSGESFKKCMYGAQLDLSGVSKSFSGKVDLNLLADNSIISGSSTVTGLRLLNHEMNDLKISFRNTNDGKWKCDGVFRPSSLFFSMEIGNDYSFNSDFKIGRKKTGTVTGRLSPLDLRINFSGFPVTKIPFSLPEKASGDINIKGTITRDSKNVSVTAKRWYIGGASPSEWKIDLMGEGSAWTFHGGSQNKDWEIGGKWSSGADWDFHAKLLSYEIQGMAGLLAPGTDLRGKISGKASYSSSGKSGEIRCTFDDFSVNNSFEGKGKLICKVTPDYINLQDFALYSKKGTLAGNAKIGLNEENSDCLSNIVFRNFPFNNALLNGPVKITGNLKAGKDWNFSGYIASDELKAHNLPARKLRAQILVTKSQIDLRNIQWEKLLSGNLAIGLENKIIAGKLSLKNIPIDSFTDKTNGTVEGELVVSGTHDDPTAYFQYTVKDSSYNNIPFEHSGKIQLRDKTVFCEKVRLVSGPEIIEISGVIYPKLNISGKIINLTSQRIARQLSPSTQTDGVFSGNFTVSGEYANPKVDAELNGHKITLDGIPITALQGRFSFQDNRVIISNALAKFTDSELRILNDSKVEINKRSYNLKTEWRNVHLGPVDVFGMMHLSGSWNDTGNEPDFNLTLKTENVWLNQHSIDETVFGIKYQEKVITFVPQSKQLLKVSGNIDMNGWPDTKFHRLSLSFENSRNIVIDGEVGKNKWDFSVSGKSVSAAAISELLDLPVFVEGDADINIIGGGNLDQPKLEGSLNISGGLVSEIPFDNFNLQFNARQDVLTIIRARLVRKNDFTIVANGFVPFPLTSAVFERVKNNPLDITFGVEEGSLNMLTALSKEIKSAAGNLRSQLHLTGTLVSPNANGYLKISNGEINSNIYFEKMTGINVSFLWKNNLLTIEEFSGKIGEGMMDIKGTMKFDGFKPEEYNLTWQTGEKRGIRISIPQLPIPSPLIKTEDWELITNYSQGEPKFQISLKGNADKPLLSGWAELENTRFTYPSIRKQTGEEDVLESFWPKLLWDLELRTGKKTWYDNALVSAQAQGSIKLTGKGYTPTADGKLEALRGNIGYLGTEFRIKRAVFEVIKDDCYLEGEAYAEVPDPTQGGTDTITMFVDRATIGSIKPRFVSKNSPNLASEKVLQRATGVDPEAYSTSDRDYLLRKSLIRIFDSTLTTPLARGLLRKSGLIDNLRGGDENLEPIKPAIPGSPTLTELFYGKKYTAEKYLSNEVMFGYSVIFDRFQDKLSLRQELELSYRMRNNIFLRGTYELESQNPSFTPDRRLMIENQWRFGWTEKK